MPGQFEVSHIPDAMGSGAGIGRCTKRLSGHSTRILLAPQRSRTSYQLILSVAGNKFDF